MRIALVSPLFESVPPKFYGGTERIVAYLCQGLTELGHEVTLFASGDSQARVDLVPTVSSALRLANQKGLDSVSMHIAQLAAVSRRAHDFDVIHNHMDYLGFPLALQGSTPVVSTLHGRLDHPDTIKVLESYEDIALVSISNAQRLPVPNLHWVGTVYHGLPLASFAFNSQPGKYLAFLGRISPEKRPDMAIAIARRSGVPLKIAAKIDAADRDYYEHSIKGLIDGTFVEYIGEINEREKSAFLGEALGLLFPIDWPEPFGLAPLEAWACGTPVLARPFGSVPEIHVDNVTGFVRNTVDELAAMVPQLANISRTGIRAHAEQHFSLHRMCEDYLNVYQQFRQGTRRAPLQLGQPNGREWRVLHSVGVPPSRYQQDRFEGQ